MADRIKDFFASLQQKSPTVSGQVVNITRDPETGRPTSASVVVGGSTIRVPLGLEAPLLGPGDHVRLEQHGTATAAEYRLLDAVAGARPAAGSYVFLEPTTLYGQTYPSGDFVVGNLLGGNVWVEYDTGNLHHRIGTQINAVDFATGEKLIGKTTLAGGVYTPVGPNMLLEADMLSLRVGTTVKISLDGTTGDAYFSGEIEAASGHVGGFAITATTLASDLDTILLDAANGIIRVGGTSDYIELLGASGAIRTKAYGTSGGLNGWQIARDGSANFNNITARGSIRASVFERGLISATAGTLLVAYSAGKLSADYTVGGTLTVDTPPGGGWLFRTGDVIEIKAEYTSGVGDTYVTVTRTATENQYSTAYSSGTNAITYPAGTGVVDWGASGDGALSLSADGVLGAAPNLSVFTHAGAPWTTKTLRARLGNLDGIDGASGYGLWTDNGYFTGVVNVTGGNAAKTDMSNVTEIDGGKIKTNSLTTAHLAVGTPGNMINNFSATNDLTGWAVPEGVVLSTAIAKDGTTVRSLRSITTTTNTMYSAYIEVEPNATYEARLSIHGAHVADVGTAYFYLFAYDENKGAPLSVIPFTVATRAWGSPTTSATFWSGNLYGGTWRDMTAYVLGCDVAAAEVLPGRNVTRHYKVPPNTRYVRLAFRGASNTGDATAYYFFSPSITPIHAATISGDMLVSGALSAGTVIAAGNVKLSDDGIEITAPAAWSPASSLRFRDGSDNVAYVAAYGNSSNSYLDLVPRSGNEVKIQLREELLLGGAIELVADSIILDGVLGSLEINGGVDIGTTGAAAGELKTSAGVYAGAGLYPSGQIQASLTGRFVSALADDATSTALTPDSKSQYGLYAVFCTNEDSSVLALAATGGFTLIGATDANWAVADTDGKHCLLISGGSAVLKNRRGGARSYRVIKIP